jgi:hypothetical protein
VRALHVVFATCAFVAAPAALLAQPAAPFVPPQQPIVQPIAPARPPYPRPVPIRPHRPFSPYGSYPVLIDASVTNGYGLASPCHPIKAQRLPNGEDLFDVYTTACVR